MNGGGRAHKRRNGQLDVAPTMWVSRDRISETEKGGLVTMRTRETIDEGLRPRTGKDRQQGRPNDGEQESCGREEGQRNVRTRGQSGKKSDTGSLTGYENNKEGQLLQGDVRGTPSAKMRRPHRRWNRQSSDRVNDQAGAEEQCVYRGTH